MIRDVRFPILNAMRDCAPRWVRGALDARAAVKAWDEQKHPRQPAGSDKGGEFAPKGGSRDLESLVVERYGITDNIRDAQFILTDGRGVNIENTHLSHDMAIARVASLSEFGARDEYELRDKFLSESGIIQVRRSLGGTWATLRKIPTDAQMDALYSYLNGKWARVEVRLSGKGKHTFRDFDVVDDFDDLRTEIGKMFTHVASKSFPDHRGRPGMRGGSLPRGAAMAERMKRAAAETGVRHVFVFSQGDGSDLDKNVRFVTNTNRFGLFERGRLRIEIHNPDAMRPKVFERSLGDLPRLVEQARGKKYEWVDESWRGRDVVVKRDNIMPFLPIN